MLEESLDCLFNLMDADRDGFVDEEELVTGLRQMFGGQKASIAMNGGSLEPAALFSRMDPDC